MALNLGIGLNKGGAPAKWKPSKIGSLVNWFKYNTKITVDALETTKVVTWGDHHGGETLTTDSGYVLENKGDLDFDTGEGRMALDALWGDSYSQFSAYLVLKVSSVTGTIQDEILGKDNSNFMQLRTSSIVRVKIGDTAANNITLPGGAVTADKWFVIGLEWEGDAISTNLKLYDDTAGYSSPTVDNDTDDFGGFASLGKRGSAFNGEIRELVLFNSILSSDDREKLMTYLISVRDE